MTRGSGPVNAPEGGVVSEVGRTGEGREPNNDTAPTPQNSGRCGGRATPTGPTKDADNRKGGEMPSRWFKGQRVRHTGHWTLGAVTGVDFDESLVEVVTDDGADRPVWWRIENVTEVV